MTHPATKTYWLEPTHEVAIGLRRYVDTANSEGCPHGHHSALVYIGRAPAIRRDDGSWVFLGDCDHPLAGQKTVPMVPSPTG